MATPSNDVKEVHYVIVVHGIGEQRPNETVPAVISRFAEARKMDHNTATNNGADAVDVNNFISMGKVAAQAGTKKREGKVSFAGESPWSQFEGIPNTFGAEVGNFNAVQSDGEDDVRFVDMYWADILDDYYKISGQSVQAWTDGVLSRLSNSGDYTGPDKQQRAWIMRVLTQVQETALFATKVAGLPWVNYGEELNHVMENVVGDVQIYGENRSVRGEAVARFHGLMEKIHEQHLKKHKIYDFDASNSDVKSRYKISEDSELYQDGIRYVRPKIHIVAHSLGTVMSMDAIMYAHVKKSVAYPNYSELEDPSKIRNLPFEMYSEQQLKKVPWDVKSDKPLVKDIHNVQKDEYVPRTEGEFIGSNWIDNIESLVTLGSPVDKFLVLYPENYDYLNGVPHGQDDEDPEFNKDEAARNVFAAREGIDFPKIRHYNYCDEQDPVGHHLDLIKHKGAYSLIFDNDEGNRDVVFNQYTVPGVAHVMYWEDQILMRRILHQTVDGDPKEGELNEQLNQTSEMKGEDFTKSHSPLDNYRKVLMYTYYLPWLISGIAMAGIFYWGWQELLTDQNSYAWPFVAALIFSMAGYLFRKIIALLIWWRQALRTKSLNAENEQSNKYHNAKSSNSFKTALRLGMVVLPILTVLSVSIALVESQAMRNSEGYSTVGTYFGLLVAGALVVYLYGKMNWTRSYSLGKRTTATQVPEWIVIASMGMMAGMIALLVYFLGDTIDDLWDFDISDKKMSAIAILLGGLTISWIYIGATLFSVKRELTDQQRDWEVTWGQRFANWENALSTTVGKYLMFIIVIAVALLLILV